jgi:Domain of unknown function (DUF4410)
MRKRQPGLGILCLLLVLGLGAAGCAGSAAGVKPAVGIGPQDLSGYTSLRVDVTKAEGVAVESAEAERIGKRIVEAIGKKQPGRFQSVNGDGAGQPTLHATVRLTRYDKGNAFARAMLAGLGSMHIDGKVSLKDPAKDANLGDYEVNKTFAWGGIYGASTSIEDVEVGFAEGVADAILGKK